METEQLRNQLTTALTDYFEQVQMPKNSLFVLGASSSEVVGEWMGQATNAEVGTVIIETLLPILAEHHVLLAVQGCQHINRALLMERTTADRFGYDEVSVIPQLHAGGAAQVAAYQQFSDPVEVEHIVAAGGMDIGDTQIGMHVKFVQIPIKTTVSAIGQAHVTFMASRPKLIGGARATYADTTI
ncbi:TIGR01440 family protein [uncultured Secundilactobacillus sp.]|uniref:TIGR01440 family protein n=1 Tax=uncultured Secundilactobacillus sp. TaxID=2813935 RepID=UPI00258D300D|nr:TIGR01440 family protein [uncultured Secundilactobacillus sp.]